VILDSPRAREVAHRLFAREAPPSSDPSAVALYRVFADAVNNLRRTVGDDGCDAVLTRAVAHVTPAHPVAAGLRRTTTANINVEQIAASIAAHGEAATRAALEAVLAAVVDLLSRLVGEAVAVSLIDQSADAPSPNSDRTFQ